jgi:hypothetical protein
MERERGQRAATGRRDTGAKHETDNGEQGDDDRADGEARWHRETPRRAADPRLGNRATEGTSHRRMLPVRLMDQFLSR